MGRKRQGIKDKMKETKEDRRKGKRENKNK
jgi:hypothetical protein